MLKNKLRVILVNTTRYFARRYTLCLIIFCCIFAIPSLATSKDFSTFSIGIPDSWQINNEGKTHTFTQEKEQCSINITITEHQNSSFNELGILLYQSLQGKSPKGDDDGFSFFVNTKSAVVSAVRMTYYGDNLVLVMASGACDNFENIVKSLAIKEQGPRPYPILAPEQTLSKQ